MTENPSTATGFDDLLEANREYAASFADGGKEAPAARGVLVLTCMDSRIDPLALLGLGLGDAKVVRNAGARLTDAAHEAVVLGVNLLGVTRVMIVPHTRCAVASNTEEQIAARVAAASGQDVSGSAFHVVTDQVEAVTRDVAVLRADPFIADGTAIGGFLYDVDTGLLTQVV